MIEAIKTEVEKINEALSGKKKIAVITHYNPDGDAIGSQTALLLYLRKRGFDVSALVPNDFPGFLKWMKGADEIIVHFNHAKTARKVIEEVEVIICVDFNTPLRMKELGGIIKKSNALRILIDHHPNPDDCFHYGISHIEASSTAELIYNFIVLSGDEHLIDKDIAESIFAGIISDTGCFSYNSSCPELFITTANLFKYGIQKDKIYNLLYDNFSYYRLKLMGYCLNEKMIVLPHFHAAYIWLTQEEMEKYNFSPGDSEGFVNLPFSIKGVHITALFTEKPDHIRISFRSRGGFPVNKISEQYFEGGGHVSAAGGESKLSMKETLEKFEKILELHKKEIESIAWFETL